MLSRAWIGLALAFFVCGLASPVASKEATFGAPAYRLD
jgi:hypothetical protein